MSEEKTPRIVQHADDAYESIRAINHLNYTSLPAPVVYAVLGNLKNVAHQMPQALTSLTDGLTRSLDTHDVTEVDRGVDPAVQVQIAGDHLAIAARLIAEAGQELEKAQTAIAGQGYRVISDE